MFRYSWIVGAVVGAAVAVFGGDAFAQLPAGYSCTGASAYNNTNLDVCSKTRASNSNTLPKIMTNATRNTVAIISGRLDSHRLAWRNAPTTAMRNDEERTAFAERSPTTSAFDGDFEKSGATSLNAGSKLFDPRARGQDFSRDLSKDLGYGAKPLGQTGNQGIAGLGNAPFVELGTGRGAANAGGGKFGVWLGGQWSFIDDDNASTGGDGYTASGMMGVDYRINDYVVAGFAFGYERTDLDTDFNRGDITGEGFTVAPYFVFNLGRIFSIDATGGYTWLDYDVSRSTLTTGNAGSSNFSSNKSTGSIDAHRWFGAANLNADVNLRNWLLGATIGGLFATESHDGFTESAGTRRAAVSSDLGRASITAKMGYAFKYVTPYVKGSYEYDFTRDEVKVQGGDVQAANDTDRFVVGGGFDVRVGGMFAAGVEGTTHLSDEDFNNYTVRVKLQLNF